MTDNWHAKGPIVVWEFMGCEGWHPRSYPDLATALTTAGITTNHVVTQLIDVPAHVSEPKAKPVAAVPNTPKEGRGPQ